MLHDWVWRLSYKIALSGGPQLRSLGRPFSWDRLLILWAGRWAIYEGYEWASGHGSQSLILHLCPKLSLSGGGKL